MQKMQEGLKESKLKYTEEELLKWDCSFSCYPVCVCIAAKGFLSATC